MPWHWHEEVELFYIENGVLEYDIPKGRIVFPKGSGGLVNSNVLHMTKAHSLDLTRPILGNKSIIDKASDKLKAMMIYIHEHYAEKLSVEQIASSAFISERECFRVFRDYLSITPAEYLRNYRLQKACQMLIEGSESITAVGLACGFGSNSYFGKIFRENIGCTPQEYRRYGGIIT